MDLIVSIIAQPLFFGGLAVVSLALLLKGLFRRSPQRSPKPRPSPTSSPPPALPSDLASLHHDAQALLAQQLMPGETARVIIQGPSDQALIATERRLFLYKRGSVAGAWFGQKMGSWDYRNITGIEMEKGLMGGAIIIQVPGAPVTDRGYFSAFELPNGLPLTTNLYDAAAKNVAEVRRLIAAYQSGDGASHGSLGQELERLAGLHERGHLTDEEFDAMKRRLLAP